MAKTIGGEGPFHNELPEPHGDARRGWSQDEFDKSRRTASTSRQLPHCQLSEALDPGLSEACPHGPGGVT